MVLTSASAASALGIAVTEISHPVSRSPGTWPDFGEQGSAPVRERYREFQRRSLEEKEREEEEQLRAPPVPLYGLPPVFQGPRTIERYRIGAGGWGARGLDTDTVHYQLIHGSRQKRPPRLLVVATSKHPEPPRQPTPLRHFLWQHVVAEMLASKRRPRLRVGRISLPEQKDVGGAERPVVVPIDHAPRTFTLIEAARRRSRS